MEIREMALMNLDAGKEWRLRCREWTCGHSGGGRDWTNGDSSTDINTLLLLLLSGFSRARLCDPIDGSPPGSSVHRILQARALEWVAISFSSIYAIMCKIDSW